MKHTQLSAYELVRKQDVSDLQSVGYLFRHKKTGARVLLLENDDENKVFTIGFRTPPEDSTGLPHILEHSVLFEYIFECDDISGQDIVSDRKLQ